VSSADQYPLLSPSHSPPVATTVPEDRVQQYNRRPVAAHDVYVDDFLSLVQGVKRRRLQVKRSLLHALDSVFRGLDTSDGPHRQEPASVKKLLKGDGTWTTVKLVLGWLIDTVRKTIQFPPHRLARLQAWRACRRSSRICITLSIASPPESGNKFSVNYAPCR
jgi:hypothetical protein